MKIPVAKRLAPAILALCIAGGGLGVTAGPRSHLVPNRQPSRSAPLALRADVGKTAKAGKETLVCKKTDGKYKWEKK